MAYSVKNPQKRHLKQQKKGVKRMPRMSKRKQLEMSLFINEKGRIEYNRLCKACIHDCKQTHKAIIVACPKYKKR